MSVPVLEIGVVPIDLIEKAAILCNKIDWASDRYTRDNDISLKTYSRLLPMQSPSAPNPEYTEQEQELVNICQLIIAHLPDEFNRLKKLNCEIATLPVDTLIRLHYDGKWFHKHSRRIHIPITTNDNCKNIWFNLSYKLELGKVYEINNRVLHGAFNKGETNRTHLILDFIEPALYNLEISEGRSLWRVEDDDYALMKPLLE